MPATCGSYKHALGAENQLISVLYSLSPLPTTGFSARKVSFLNRKTGSHWEADKIRYGPNSLILQPALWAIAVYRFGRWSLTAPRVLRPVSHFAYFCAYSVVRLLTGIDLPRRATFGPGLLIHHFGGIIVHPQTIVGARCVMRHGVTLGARDASGPPRLGDDVVIGAYAQILGSISVGDGAKIGAMAVVLKDVPAGATVVGNPARTVTSRNKD